MMILMTVCDYSVVFYDEICVYSAKINMVTIPSLDQF